MTTKFLDNKICTFNILLSWRFPRKQAFLDDFPLCPQKAPPPQKRKFYFYCRLAVSDSCVDGALSERAPLALNFERQGSVDLFLAAIPQQTPRHFHQHPECPRQSCCPFLFRRPPDYSSNLHPPKTLAV